ncbi:v-type H+-transporting ATPase subunit H [Fusarium beomiforme]|uniref:V-type H+-transporting ATPase subunit H n=1 Tax=Fusarium beomiforme TaxID=44412 RepID=A0A9P5AM49_9HYPO|nr:v-type H+-transporting ATPase subunit H [Fusarium beomiforme]
MAQGYAVFIGLVVIAALCVASWFLAPKGENQVLLATTQLTLSPYRLWRSSAILAIVSCYLMWAITFLAQLHPLIAPRKSGIREEHLH